jgi:hypothetical protein
MYVTWQNLTGDSENLIGIKVEKVSRKPFKSGLLVNTVKGYSTNPYTGKLCFTFEEDDSAVECFRCQKSEPKE